MDHFILGISYLITGFKLLFKSGLRRFVAIPVLINIVLFIGLFFLLRHYVSEFNAWFAHFLPHWLQWLSYILWLIFIVSFFLIFIYTFVTIANLISAPFNNLLSEKVELYLTGKTPTGRSLWENVKDVPRVVGRQFLILGYYVPRAIAILILFFVPLVQMIAPLIWFVFNAWYLSLTYIDYPTDNHRIPIQDVRVWLKERYWIALGFGFSVLVASMVPVLNFFVIPAAVIGATKFWVETSRSANKTILLNDTK